MKKLILKLKFLILILLWSLTSHSQLWVEMMHDPKANFYETQAVFNDYWKDKKIEKGKGYKAFRRWEAYMEPRVYPSGDVTLPSQNYGNYKQWLEEFSKEESFNPKSKGGNQGTSLQKSISGDWQPMGPIGKPSGGGAGRINFIRFDPANSNTMYVGAPDGGLWKTTDGGTTWSTNTDQLTVIGCSDIAIASDNSDLMYLATGDSDGADTYSVGVLKSTDGGATWNTTGLTFNVSAGVTIGRLLIDPTNSDIVTAFGSNGIWRTTNGGTSWAQPTGTFNGIKDAEYKPGSTTVMYAAGTIFKRSTDGGLNWTSVATGLSNIQRLAIAVTPANANYVYILATRTTDNGFNAVLRSTDSGATFTSRMSAGATNNIMGWDNGADAGGQGWYDVAIAASPTNAEEIYTGGVNMWKSTNGGTSFTLNSHWYGGYSKPYVHADIHDIIFLPGSGTTVFSGNDGGIFKTVNSGTAWTDISSNLSIAQQYRIGLSASLATLLVAGHQDNGTNKYNSAVWSQIYGGDGMDCFIDRTNNNTIYASYVYGEYKKSTNGGSSWTAIVTGIPNGTASQNWLCAWHQDPVTANTLYAGGRPALYRTTNGGTSWSAIGTPTGTGNITEFVVAPSDNTVIYAIKSGTNAVSKSTNSGTSWTAVSTGLPTSVAPTCIQVSNTDANVVFVTYSGYGASNKVFKSTNGGTSWTNISTGLPNLPVNTIVYQNGSANDAIYVGTDVGIYYKDNSTGWISFNTNLPRVGIRDLEIYYPTNRLRAATYGRGTWDSDLYTSVPASPTADFTASSTTVCATNSVTFTNTSTGIPESYVWSFEGGTPSTSTATNPSVTYNTPGSFTVTLTATNPQGSDEEIKTAFITVLDNIGASLPITEGFVDATFPPTDWTLVNLDLGSTWTRSATVGRTPTLSNSMFFNNYNFNDIGNQDEMRVPRVNLAGLSSAQMTFDVAYAPYDATNFDGLQVLVSSDCQQTFTSVYSKSNTTLATASPTTSPFAPTVGQWRTETIDLSAYLGQTNVVIAFRNLAGYGNNLYVDNINITGVEALNADFTASSTNICQGETVVYTSTSTGTISSYSWDFGANASPATAIGIGPHSVTYSVAGQKTVSLNLNAGGDVETKIDFVSISSLVTADSPDNRFANNSYHLPVLINGNYYTGPNGTGTLLTAGSIINTNQTLYVYATNGQCSDENSFNVTILTFLRSSNCGKNISSLNEWFYCNPISSAINYRYEVSDGTTTWSYTKGSASTRCRFSEISNSITYGNSYTVRVAYTEDGVNWTPYGKVCTLNVLTKLKPWYCGTNSSINAYKSCYEVPVATDYRYKLNDGSNTLIYTRGSSDIGFRLSWVPGIQLNTTYSLSVAAYVDGSWTSYGNECYVITPALGLIQNPNEDQLAKFEITGLNVYPNPNNGEFTISSSHEGTFNIINELGQLKQTVEISKENNYETKIEGLHRGLYFITGTINGNVVTNKIVVQ